MEASSWVRWPGAVDRGMGVEFLRKDTEYSMVKAFIGVNARDGVDFPEGKPISDWPGMGSGAVKLSPSRSTSPKEDANITLARQGERGPRREQDTSI